MAIEEKTYPLMQILELSCAANRVNSWASGVNVYQVVAQTIKQTLGVRTYSNTKNCEVLDHDRKLAKEIHKYFQRLTFSVIAGNFIRDKAYERKLYLIFQAGVVKKSEITAIAKLPNFINNYKTALTLKQKTQNVRDEYTGVVGTTLFDKECEVILSRRCVNYDGFNIYGLIDNKMVTWYSSFAIPDGILNIERAKIKNNEPEWEIDLKTSRLSSVRIINI